MKRFQISDFRFWIRRACWVSGLLLVTCHLSLVTDLRAQVRTGRVPHKCPVGSLFVKFTTATETWDCASTRRVLSINLLSPTTAETNLIQSKFPAAVTVTRVSCSVDSGTSVVIQFDERAEATPNVAGTNVLTSNLTCNTTNGGITTSFSNAGIAANAPLNLQIISATGNPNAVRIHVEYTID